jgi:hypothetical protein
MPKYTHADLAEARARFRRNRNPGAGVVQGLGGLGTAQQVLWHPRYDAYRHDTVLQKDIGQNDKLRMAVYSRRGHLLASHLMMDSVATAGQSRLRGIRRMSHMATTSTYGEQIAKALRYTPLLPKASLDPEADRYHTPGVTGLIVSGPVPSYRTGPSHLENSSLLVHRPAYRRSDDLQPHHDAPEYDTLADTVFEPGVGVGVHAFDGSMRRPFTGHRYPFPLGSSAENTLDIYTDLLGKRRGVNIAVKETLGSSVIALVAANASGDPA